jgi:hypothetical protein
MMRYPRSVLIILIFAIDILCLKSQSNDLFVNTLKDKLATWCRSVPFEDIYIHSDRDSYIAGEFFWFNTYLFDRQSSSLSSGSSYAYIELLDAENQPVSQTKVRLDNGSGGGGFRIPDTLSNGEYTLRAYTNRMKNFLPDGCFMKTVTVYNPLRETVFKKISVRSLTDNPDYEIALFPEGGRLLNGFVNKVGIRVFYKGSGKQIFKGYLSDINNDTIASVVVDSTGIGSFDFFAERGKMYRLVSEKGKDITFLPVISQTGFSLNVKNSENGLLRITVNTEGISRAGANYFYFVIQSHGNVLSGRRVDFSGKSTELLIPGGTFNPGINQIAIFDTEGNPVCSRFVFNPLPKSDNIILKTADKTGRREKISLEIEIDTGMISKAEMANFSLSVSAKKAAEKRYDISDYLITGSEFAAPTGTGLPTSLFKMSPELIDNYLLSVKSNWIDWEDVIRGRFPEIKYPRENKRQYISGFYINRDKTEANLRKVLFLSIPGKIPVFKYSETDNNNRFIFAIQDNESANEYVIQPASADNSYSLQIESPFSDRFPEFGYSSDSTKKPLSDEAAKWSINYQVEKIYGISDIGDTIKTTISRTKPVRFYGKPDQELIMSDYISLPAMEEVFFELIPGVIVRTNKSKYGIFLQDPDSRKYYESLPALLVDGVVINDPSIIINLDPELVEKIDVIKGKYIVGELVFSGIINVITKAGDFSNITSPQNIIRIRNNSYDPVRRYISPDYSSVSGKTSRIPDFRNTLFWSHNLKPGSMGKINVEIVTSDFGSDYEINFQGAAGGRFFSARKTIRVE